MDEKPERRSRFVQVRLTNAERERVKHAAMRLDLSLSTFVRRELRRATAAVEEEHPLH